jgi:hypothetical protein
LTLFKKLKWFANQCCYLPNLMQLVSQILIQKWLVKVQNQGQKDRNQTCGQTLGIILEGRLLFIQK